MRPGVEAGGFERFAHLGERLGGGLWQRQVGAMQQPVDVEAPEADPFEVKRRDRPLQSFALVEQLRARVARRLPAHNGNELSDPVLCRFPVIGGVCHTRDEEFN